MLGEEEKRRFETWCNWYLREVDLIKKNCEECREKDSSIWWKSKTGIECKNCREAVEKIPLRYEEYMEEINSGEEYYPKVIIKG